MEEDLFDSDSLSVRQRSLEDPWLRQVAWLQIETI